MVNFMLDRGAMINLRNDKRGETALVKASWDGQDEVVQTLLERGALIDTTDMGKDRPHGGLHE
jgi:ankyrin repeat protein